MSARTVYTCDWCMVEADAGQMRVEGREVQDVLPEGWNEVWADPCDRPEEIICGDCLVIARRALTETLERCVRERRAKRLDAKLLGGP